MPWPVASNTAKIKSFYRWFSKNLLFFSVSIATDQWFKSILGQIIRTLELRGSELKSYFYPVGVCWPINTQNRTLKIWD